MAKEVLTPNQLRLMAKIHTDGLLTPAKCRKEHVKTVVSLIDRGLITMLTPHDTHIAFTPEGLDAYNNYLEVAA